MELEDQGKVLMIALENQFKIRAAEIQKISTGDLPVESANKNLIRNMAQYLAIKNSLRVAGSLNNVIEKFKQAD